MKKTFVSVFVLLGFLSLKSNASSSSNLNQPVLSVNDAVLKQGTIVEVTQNGGRLMDNTTGEILDFFHPGAQVSFVVGDSVTYLVIKTPTGKPPIVKDIKKP